ncbi:hypothetical protein [Modicisalibacter coralii]|uniref:hypothetical protein n=1 Tax=Modicisalibacter coralii TaxID=2304602 RepID=UPI00100B8E4D|nr:hypothetical protein [Halomonas coralii]
MSKRYFKLDQPYPEGHELAEHGTPIGAMLAHVKKRKELSEAVKPLEDEFDGAVVFREGVYVAGLKLNNYPSREDAELWRKPDRHYPHHSNLRTPSALKGKANAENRERLREMHKRWDEIVNQCPKISRDDQWLIAGHRQIDLMFGGASMAADYEAGAVYFAAHAEPKGVPFTEITGGEFDAAVERANKQNAEDYLDGSRSAA